jgi:CheY-like chemotaxis protein
MFWQVDRSIERQTGGLGIGLALVKGIVEMHHGSISAQSPGHGQGSTFTVRLPIVAPAAEGHSANPSVLPSGDNRLAGPHRRILVVDDNVDSAKTMSLMLGVLGNEVATAYDGLQALEEVARFHPDVILMDVGMPHLNGYEAARRIRESSACNGLKIVALTGWGQETDRQKSFEAGCDAHLVKPVSLDDLNKLLNSFAMNEARSRSEVV